MPRVSVLLALCLAIACSGGGPSEGSAPSVSAPAGAPPSAGAASGADGAANPYLAQPGQPLTTVKVASCAVTGGFIQLYTAMEAKLFEKYGMTVEQSVISGSGPSLAAMSSGDIHFLYCAAD